ncbi:DUF2273 domain-containing protein [Anaerosalibacter bizertensis]|uniref:DUF2273 domain-containing protein n=1 Tax=Anaerosalibacter bizertensis TaxID=932217 RepID=A0A844FFY3_9FIRM|nr:DUF2273 domain-containing protein [Anaerosalibacter bizertensis]MBV1817391.1 DUF2273 domain-containing protein [Bacteroidales bacterium MSK.15.36]HHV26218.1 DUF2273 domain-containing protein [Tissierellia bacterium]MCG4581666.1 DUF2273 domain-containing protein [Anaerosalibacter bizertensis]MCG4584384.1 DUF2273 domain-containing protein [Anaerosalibacter bizertensis]
MVAKEIFSRFIQLLDNNKGRTIGAIIGFIVSILILTIGFFKTLFIVICTGLGYFFGKKSDNQEDLKEFLNKILPPGKTN